MDWFGTLSLEEGAESAVKHMNLLQVTCCVSNKNVGKRATFKDCPLVWDTGASFSLTPFQGYFVDYVECSITVRDISCDNTVIGIGTTCINSKSMKRIYICLVCLTICHQRKYHCLVPRLITCYTVDIAWLEEKRLRCSLAILRCRWILIEVCRAYQ